ncbi:hypothetical protein X975_20114, partial [Stegodyphus mimosarum]
MNVLNGLSLLQSRKNECFPTVSCFILVNRPNDSFENNEQLPKPPEINCKYFVVSLPNLSKTNIFASSNLFLILGCTTF